MPDVFPGLPTRDACPRPRTWERQSMRRPLFQNAVQRLSDQTVAFSFEGVLLNEVIDRSVQYVDGRCISCGRNVCSGRTRACVCIFQIRTRSCRLRWMKSGRRGWWRRRGGRTGWEKGTPTNPISKRVFKKRMRDQRSLSHRKQRSELHLLPVQIDHLHPQGLVRRNEHRLMVR